MDDTDLSGSTPAKRKLSPSFEGGAPPVKVAKTHSNHLQINYLARQFPEILPLISVDDSLPSLLNLIGEYDGVLQRHESMAGNLGANPLGPMLIKRFERLFDGPPKVLKSHGKEGTMVGWLDVVEFARNKPEQFNLEKMREGVRVCQFYTKQSRVEITEEDYLVIASGMPQKLIPPQPIMEDEEKELGTLEILEKNLSQVVQLADQVSARARQLNHRLKNRKNAIISRREAEAAATEDLSARSPASSTNIKSQANGEQRSSVSPPSGFVAVNQRSSNQDVRNDYSLYNGASSVQDPVLGAKSTNGGSTYGASAATRAELLSKFFTTSERAASMDRDQRRLSMSNVNRPSSAAIKKLRPGSDDYGPVNSTSPVPIPNTPSNLMPYAKPSQADRFDDSGPYKAEMMTRMEQLNRGDRVQPPCDRCRRLHMDCRKNLTACMGCTKKHAKCSWKDVTDQELQDNPIVMRSSIKDDAADSASGGEGGKDPYKDLPTISQHNTPHREWPREEPRGVRDEELLGEEASGDDEDFPNSRTEEVGRTERARTAMMTATEAGSLTNKGDSKFETGFQHQALPSPLKEGDLQTQIAATEAFGDNAKREQRTQGQREEREREALVQLSRAAREAGAWRQDGANERYPQDGMGAEERAGEAQMS